MRDHKALLRGMMRKRRAAIPGEQRRREAQAVGARLIQNGLLDSCRRLAVYRPLPSEVDVAPVVIWAAARNMRLAVPAFVDEAEGYGWADYRPGEPETAGPHRILQPAERRPLTQAEAPDVIIVPGLAFDLAGGRLGFGAGCYDRLLQMTPAALRIGIAFEPQIVDSLPAETHDEPMDFICTPGALTPTSARPASLLENKTNNPMKHTAGDPAGRC